MRIKALEDDSDPKKVDEMLGKIKKGAKEPKETKTSILSVASKKATKKEEKEEEKDIPTESEDEQIDLTKTSNKKKTLITKKNAERSRDDKISKEKPKDKKESEKQMKIPDLSNKKSKQSDKDSNNNINNNIKQLPKSTPKQDKNKPQVKEESSQQSKHVIKKTPFTPQKKESSEEASLSEESEKKSKASREKKVLQKAAKQQLPSAIDTSQISDEISKIIKRIEEKRKKVGGASEKRRLAGKASNNASLTKRDRSSTAELYSGILQLNSNIKVEHVIDIKELQKKDKIAKTDVLLGIIEIAMNSSYYSLSSYNRSKSFWEDVLKYKELKKIFEPLKAETLKKYWININITGDPLQVADFIKKNKKIFDTYKIMVLPMISTAAEYFKRNIDNLEDYIKNIPREPFRAETKFTETVDLKTGKVITEKKKTLTTYKRARHAEPIRRIFTGRNNVNDVDEIIDG